MRNAFAEWLLSRVIDKGRAAAIAGDLLEIHDGKGGFWPALVVATATIAVHRPLRLIGHVLGFALCCASYVFMFWTLTHVVGISWFWAIASQVPVELLNLWRSRRRRPEIAPRAL